jgi:hypothetical protein
MSHLCELDPIRRELEKYVVGMAGQMGGCAICLSLFTDNYKKGLDSMLQFAVAIMLDKPIYLLVKKGTVVPEKVKKLADGIEFFDEHDKDSLEKASRKLFLLAQQKGFVE